MPAARRSGPAASSAAPAAAAGKKRKMEGDKKDQTKYYAVKAGNKPGIYMTWPECQEQISGFSGALFKSFPTLADAQAYIQGKVVPGAGAKDKGDKFYAVARGNQTGIFTTWEEASLAIKGAKGPKYKKFATMREAEAFMRMYGEGAQGVGEEGEDSGEDDEEAELAEPSRKMAKTAEKVDDDVLIIYTDGSSLSNGKVGATAGLGVYFGPGDERNISERLTGPLQTNQRAELTAIQRALQVVAATQSVLIFTDSQYSIKCATEWYKSWVKKGWKSSTGTAVKNRDLVEGIRELIEQRDAAGASTTLKWVKGHADNVGNQQADILAVQGSRMR